MLKNTAQIIAAFAAHNKIDPDRLPALIKAVHCALKGDDLSLNPPKKLKPAVSVNNSVFPTYIVCLEDGVKRAMLKRYLKLKFNLSPDDYRKKWGLPQSYPMVAPDHALRRAAIARSVGLGGRPSPGSKPATPAA